MFHKGAFINDKTSLLQGDDKEARQARFLDMTDIEEKKEALQLVIRAWIVIKDNE